MQTLLVIDDELSVRESYRLVLADDYRLLLAEDATIGLNMLDKNHVDLILLDLTMPGMTGIEFLQELEQRGEATPVIVVTGSNSVKAAVDSIKGGAREFVIKPFDVDELTLLVSRTLEEQREKRELAALREQGTTGFDNIVGDSPALIEALARARQAMQVDSTVLITGETGTGKDVMARAVHYGSNRSKKPFVPISCCAIPASLVESELFGHTKGAFTGATDNRMGKMQIADTGTLFLDEIGEMPLDAQSKLLRVLQDGCFFSVGGTKQIEVDVRFICATNRNFMEAIADGIFRQDLYYRIAVLPIEIPPLRKRREDIPKLVAYFIAKHQSRVNAKVDHFNHRAMSLLMAYDWPGNIRELENTVERILVCNANERIITPESLNGLIPQPKKITPLEQDIMDEYEGLPLQEATQRLERRLILHALERSKHVQSQAAEILGTTRRILKYKMDQLGIDPEGERQSIAS